MLHILLQHQHIIISCVDIEAMTLLLIILCLLWMKVTNLPHTLYQWLATIIQRWWKNTIIGRPIWCNDTLRYTIKVLKINYIYKHKYIPSIEHSEKEWKWGCKTWLSLNKSSNTGWISADRSSKATLPLTVPRSSQVVCKGFTPMTSGIVMLGTQSHHVNDPGGTNVYALASG